MSVCNEAGSGEILTLQYAWGTQFVLLGRDLQVDSSTHEIEIQIGDIITIADSRQLKISIN
jgi:hypothetical protein